MNNLKGELAIMDNLGIKPNYASLGREYGMGWSPFSFALARLCGNISRTVG